MWLLLFLIQDSIEGTWHGAVTPGGVRLRIDIHLSRDKDGALSGTLDSLDQAAKGLKLDGVSFENETLKFTLTVAKATFEGKLKDGKIDGVLKQAGMDMPLVFGRAPLEEPKRPQTPKKPYPYKEEEVKYAHLAGTLTLPNSEGPHTAVILITGSGQQDRDETLLGHKPFLVIADHLTRQGIAVLRVDDRGVGGSKGDVEKATSEDFADDVLKGVEFLAARKDIGKIGLVGHSEGGLIAPMVAVKSDKVAFIALLAGPGTTGREILLAQSELIQRAMGVPEETIQKNLEESKKRIEAEQNPWMKFFISYDPRETLKKVKCPVLAMNGEKDLQVPCKENLKGIEEALKGNPHVKIVALPDLNHLFQTCKTGAPSEYAQIEETFAPAALDTLSTWIRER
jgi:hypothetical protein